MQQILIGIAAVVALAAPAHASFRDVLDYARLGDTTKVIALLAAGDEPNAPDYHDGYAPLQFAAGNGDVVMTRALLAAGADTEYRDHNGDRALIWAAQRGSVATVKLLLDAGSPADSNDPYGQTPAMDAAESGHVEVLRLLIAAGADMGRRDQTGMTVLHYAARLDAPAAVAMVLAAGGNPNVFDEIALETPLHEAARSSNGAAIPLLLDAGASLAARTRQGDTPLFLAATSGNLPVLLALLSAGADPDAVNLQGQSPILAAIALNGLNHGRQKQAIAALATVTADIDRAFSAALWNRLPRAALTLLRRGANANALDEGGHSALAASVHYPGLMAFEELVRRGADIGRYGPEALRAAATEARPEIIGALLGLGVDIDSGDEIGATPLLYAVKAGHVETVRYLLAHGADVHATDARGDGAAAYMQIVPSLYAIEIESRSASRAWKPTLHLEIDLDAIRARHAQIRELLAQN